MTWTGRAADDEAATREAVERALAGVDVAVVCGGVSVGGHDHVRPSLAALGAEERFWGLALKPGSPAWFGPRGRTLVFGLPGNPVSAMVTFVLLVGARPAGDAGPPARGGARRGDPRPRLRQARRAAPTRCAAAWTAADGLYATPTGPQGSHVLSSMLGADALAIVASRRDRCERPASACTIEQLANGRRPCARQHGRGARDVRLFAMLRERAGHGHAGARASRRGDGRGRARGAAEQGRARRAARPPAGPHGGQPRLRERTPCCAPATSSALIPPVSGGAPGGARCTHALVTAEPLSLERLRRTVSGPAARGRVIFQGVTREVEALDYEAYVEMARERIEAILRRVRGAPRPARGGGRAPRRPGVPLGEPSVIVAVSAAHREEAFAGAREAIDRSRSRRRSGSGSSAAAGRALGGGRRARVEADYERGRRRGRSGAGRRMSARLTHLDEHGRARMVDVGGKAALARVARARARLR